MKVIECSCGKRAILYMDIEMGPDIRVHRKVCHGCKHEIEAAVEIVQSGKVKDEERLTYLKQLVLGNV